MMSYVSVYENKTPRAKGVLLAGAVHAAIIAGVIAMPGIEVAVLSPIPGAMTSLLVSTAAMRTGSSPSIRPASCGSSRKQWSVSGCWSAAMAG